MFVSKSFLSSSIFVQVGHLLLALRKGALPNACSWQLLQQALRLICLLGLLSTVALSCHLSGNQSASAQGASVMVTPDRQLVSNATACQWSLLLLLP